MSFVSHPARAGGILSGDLNPNNAGPKQCPVFVGTHSTLFIERAVWGLLCDLRGHWETHCVGPRPSQSASRVTFVTGSTVCILSLVYPWPGAQFCISKQLVAPPSPPARLPSTSANLGNAVGRVCLQTMEGVVAIGYCTDICRHTVTCL